MRDQEIIGLWEAYQQVYAQPQEEVEVVDDAPEKVKESVDLFDYLLEYLVAEGYADTNKAALVIMANMSEEWKQSIVEEYGSLGANAAGYALQKIKERRVREQEREKIEQERREASSPSSQVKGV